MLWLNPLIRPRNAVVIGPLCGLPDCCWAARAMGRANIRIAMRDSFIRSPAKVAEGGWGWRFDILGTPCATRNGLSCQESVWFAGSSEPTWAARNASAPRRLTEPAPATY